MNNYKELIALLDGACMFKITDMTEESLYKAELFAQAAEAIEQLIKERNAAITDIEKYCRYCIVCKNADFTDSYRHNKCHKCLDDDNRYFEWRGVREEENATD